MNWRPAVKFVISVYPRSFKDVAKKYLSRMKDGAILMDFCGIKRGIEVDMKELSLEYPNVSFIGAHPMAGREFSGIVSENNDFKRSE